MDDGKRVLKYLKVDWNPKVDEKSKPKNFLNNNEDLIAPRTILAFFPFECP